MCWKFAKAHDGQENPLEEEMVIHSSILAWRILWTEEPDRLQFKGLQRVRHNWACVYTHTHSHTHRMDKVCIECFLLGISDRLEHCLVSKSCPTLLWPMDYSQPGSSVRGIFQARILEWIAISSSRGSSPPRNQVWVSCIASGFFTCEPPRKPGALSNLNDK